MYLNEIFAYDTLPTSAVRNVYSPDTGTARELHVSKLADAFGMDDYEFRRAFVKDDGWRAVLDKVAERGDWGRTMPDGHRAGDRAARGVPVQGRLLHGDRRPPGDGQPQDP